MSDFSISATPGALQSAQLGIRQGLSGLDRDAQVIANSGAASIDTGSVVNALVDSLQQRLLVEASARMLATADKTLGTLIDVKA